jgi:hypothetical protein
MSTFEDRLEDDETVHRTDEQHALPEYQITLARVQVEDEDGETQTLWKGNCDGEKRLSASPTDAVMGALERATGGVL